MLVLSILLFAACSNLNANTPAYKLLDQHLVSPALGITQSDNGYSDYEVYLYTEIFLELWQLEEFPQNPKLVSDTMALIEIHWQPTVFNYTNFIDGNTRLLGLTRRDLKPPFIQIFVALSRYQQKFVLDNSAYGHELIHVMLGAITGNPSADHLRSDGLTDWPSNYEDFLKKVSIEYRKRLHENTRINSNTSKRRP